jgi:hypothetical protein
VRPLRAFVLGFVGVGLLAYVAAAALALSAEVGGRSLDLGLGPLSLVVVERSGSSTSLTFGAGLVVIALVGGVANAVAAAVLARRARRRQHGIH